MIPYIRGHISRKSGNKRPRSQLEAEDAVSLPDSTELPYSPSFSCPQRLRFSSPYDTSSGRWSVVPTNRSPFTYWPSSPKKVRLSKPSISAHPYAGYSGFERSQAYLSPWHSSNRLRNAADWNRHYNSSFSGIMDPDGRQEYLSRLQVAAPESFAPGSDEVKDGEGRDRTNSKDVGPDRFSAALEEMKNDTEELMSKLDQLFTEKSSQNLSLKTNNGSTSTLDGFEETIKTLQIRDDILSTSLRLRDEQIRELEAESNRHREIRSKNEPPFLIDQRIVRLSKSILEDVLAELILETATDAEQEEQKLSAVDYRKEALTSKEKKLVKKALNNGDDEHVLITKYNVDMTRRLVKCLRPLTWLNDEVINFYFKLLQDRDAKMVEDKGVQPSHFFNTFFHTKLAENGYCYRNVRRWTRKVNIFAMDKVLFPVHVGQMHWCLAVVFVKTKKIQYYDSMGGSGAKTLKILKRYLEDEKEDKNHTGVDLSGWTLVPTVRDETPQQMNSSDCGVFTCMFADYVSANEDLKFSQMDIPHFRERMVASIVKGSLD